MLIKLLGSQDEINDGIAMFSHDQFEGVRNIAQRLDHALNVVSGLRGHPILARTARVVGTVDEKNSIDIHDKYALEAFRVSGITNRHFSTTAFSQFQKDGVLTVGLIGRRRERYVYVHINRGLASTDPSIPEIRKQMMDELCKT